MTHPSRRDVLRTSLAAGASLALGSSLTPLRAAPQDSKPSPKKLKILVFGGTAFLGPAIVQHALSRGHELTLFNRGRTRTHLFPDVERIQGNRDPKKDEGLKNLAAEVEKGRKWDTVIDDIAAFPRPVAACASLLKESARQYVLISSISAYASTAKPGQDESSPVATMSDETLETYGKNFEHYGALKALCERAAEGEFKGRTTNIRPGYIVGPDDPTDRFTYWPARYDQGGEMLWPGNPEDPIQIIDVRDLGAWIVHCVEQQLFGVFNACGPKTPWSMRALQLACKAASGKDTKCTWVPETFLTEHGEKGDEGIPIWMSPTGEGVGMHRFSNAKALRSGLTLRDPSETVKDLLAWWRKLPATKTATSRDNKLRAGIKAEKEQQILAAWAKK